MKIPESPPNPSALLEELEDVFGVILGDNAKPAPGGKYRHWDTLRRLRPPKGLTTEAWWAAIKFSRAPFLRELSLEDREGGHFKYALVDPVLERLHRIDRETSGGIQLPEPVTNPQTRDRYVQSSLIEEAITSSQLEGAATTREMAKEMIRMKRKPVTLGERMILNNYRTMQFVVQLKDESLTPELLFRIHRYVTEGTLEHPDRVVREPGDGIGVYDNTNNVLLHRPPPAEQIEERIERLCAFANEAETGVFLHPVVKAIVLHFWLAYDHPFVDGNGRTARTLFYWYVLKEGFWLFEYLSISRVLKKAPARYAKSFLYTETDDNDLTYFILAQLRVIEQAIADLHTYLERKVRETRETAALLRPGAELNHRQIALLSHAVRHPGHRYTFRSHQTSHRITYQTARTDLLVLAERALLVQTKSGRQFVFVAPTDLAERLKALGAE